MSSVIQESHRPDDLPLLQPQTHPTSMTRNTTQESECLNAELKPKGLYIRTVLGDGNCLFRAVADQIANKESNYKVYRDLAIRLISKNKRLFQMFLEESESIDEYITEITKDGKWSGYFEIVALSEALGVEFCIHMKEKEPYIVSP